MGNYIISYDKTLILESTLQFIIYFHTYYLIRYLQNNVYVQTRCVPWPLRKGGSGQKMGDLECHTIQNNKSQSLNIGFMNPESVCFLHWC